MSSNPITVFVEIARNPFTYRKRVREARDQARLDKLREQRNSPTLDFGSVTIVNPVYAGPNPYRGPEVSDPRNRGRVFIPVRKENLRRQSSKKSNTAGPSGRPISMRTESGRPRSERGKMLKAPKHLQTPAKTEARGAEIDPVAYSAEFMPWYCTDKESPLIEKFRDENEARRAGAENKQSSK